MAGVKAREFYEAPAGSDVAPKVDFGPTPPSAPYGGTAAPAAPAAPTTPPSVPPTAPPPTVEPPAGASGEPPAQP
jgi:hypothetical protein